MYIYAKKSFNRTILELKFQRFRNSINGVYSFNRTILELKSVTGRRSSALSTFNRTILELKYRNQMAIGTNWTALQSHHTGIEMHSGRGY